MQSFFEPVTLLPILFGMLSWLSSFGGGEEDAKKFSTIGTGILFSICYCCKCDSGPKFLTTSEQCWQANNILFSHVFIEPEQVVYAV